MKKISLALILIIVGICIPAVSAEVLYDEQPYYYQFTGGKCLVSPGTGAAAAPNFNVLYFSEISRHQDISYIGLDFNSEYVNLDEGSHDMTYTYNGKQKTGRIIVSKTRNILNQITSSRAILYFHDWDTEGLTGHQTVTFSPGIGSGASLTFGGTVTGDVSVYSHYLKGTPYTVTVSSGIEFRNHIIISDDAHTLTVNLQRNINGKYSASELIVYDMDNNVIYKDYSTKNRNEIFLTADIKNITLATPHEKWVYDIAGKFEKSEPVDEPTVTVYIKNSQTGALIANANVAIDALVNGEYYPVTNRTEPSGIFSINLQPTGGGQPNPDGYRLIVTADGYNNPMPEINFTVDDYKLSIYCLLDPIAGGPVNENKTFIDFFVRDMTSNPISGATVKFGKYTLITNSVGYTVFEVDKNNNYSWTISKSGYGSLTGNAVIGDAPRHTINTVLAPAVTPTKPTSIPTSTPISPTPTMTAPTGESVSNWLEWFAAHFGMILGGGAEIGKIFMWLCFAVPVGVYVGKEAKAGAAGFMAGAGIVTLFFALIGWVPIWLLVLLALIIGLLYAKVFNNPDNGGGR